tara:strand:- start:839 stop:1543 length:705 start_codon:yes stop_codon:yes gene_type:complete
MNICLIPARSGSKRLKNKNIKNFFGKPIIAYTIKTAIKSKLFDEVIVSTDSNKYISIAKKYGATVPFLRSKKLSSDYARDVDVIKDFIKKYKRNKISIKTLCYLYPINPLLKKSTLIKCFKKIKKKNVDKVITLKKFTYPIQRSYFKNNKGKFIVTNKKYFMKRSQDLQTFYHDAAQCYWYKIQKKLKFFKKTAFITDGIELNQFESYDVDVQEDMENLKKIYKYRLHNKFINK